MRTELRRAEHPRIGGTVQHSGGPRRQRCAQVALHVALDLVAVEELIRVEGHSALTCKQQQVLSWICSLQRGLHESMALRGHGKCHRGHAARMIQGWQALS